MSTTRQVAVENVRALGKSAKRDELLQTAQAIGYRGL